MDDIDKPVGTMFQMSCPFEDVAEEMLEEIGNDIVSGVILKKLINMPMYYVYFPALQRGCFVYMSERRMRNSRMEFFS